MGKGDKKTKRGKIIQGSYGVTRRKKSNTVATKQTIVKAVKENPVTDAVVDENVKAVKKTTVRKTTKKKEEPTSEVQE